MNNIGVLFDVIQDSDPNKAHGRVAPEEFNDTYKSKCKGRAITNSTQRAFQKRVSKRRARKGYK